MGEGERGGGEVIPTVRHYRFCVYGRSDGHALGPLPSLGFLLDWACSDCFF